MADYSLTYNHRYWVNAADNDDYLKSSVQAVRVKADSDEEAIKKAEEFLNRPTGQKWFPRMGEPEQELLNTGIQLSRLIKVWG